MSNIKNWNTANIPDLNGKIVIITGGNSGLGLDSAKAMTAAGAKVIIACRSAAKGLEAKNEIKKLTPNGLVEVMELDLMNLASVRKFANEFKAKYQQLNVLLNNAGIMIPPYQLTADGFESQIGTNHLGHFALTGLLLDVLQKTPKARVVTVSSMAHKQGVMNFDNFLYDGGNGYTPIAAYGRSKLCNLLFSYELQRYFDAKKLDIIAISAHPGVSNTNLFRFVDGKWWAKALRPLMMLFVQSSEMGALPQLRASTSPGVLGGEYYGPKGFAEMTGYPVVVKSNAASHNLEHAKKLWEVSEKLTGVKFS